jgi:4-hydroxy-L-threonine phosphate dehydrogenase PdxA
MTLSSATKPAELRPRLGLLLGDCTGIGPEVIAKVLSDRRIHDAARIVVVGDVRVLALGMHDAKVSLRYAVVPNVAAIDWASDSVPVIDLGNIDPSRFKQGNVSPESGKLTGDSLGYAIEMSKRGEIDAITFAPLNKRISAGDKIPQWSGRAFRLRRNDNPAVIAFCSNQRRAGDEERGAIWTGSLCGPD